MGRLHCSIRGRGLCKGGAGWKIDYCVGDTFRGNFFDVGAVETVMLHGGADIPSVNSVGDQVPWLSGSSLTIMRVPGVPRGVWLK